MNNHISLANCLKKAETSVVLIVFTVSSVMSALVLLPFIIVAQHESGTRKTIYPAISTFAVQIYHTNNFLLYS